MAARSPLALAYPLQPGLGADIHIARPVLPRGQAPPKARNHHTDVGVTAVRFGDGF